MDKFRAWLKRNACIFEVFAYVWCIICATMVVAPYLVN